MRYLFREILLKHKGMLLVLCAVAAVLPIAELLSVGMVLPVLTSLLETGSATKLPGVLADWQALFDGMGLERKLWVLAFGILILSGIGFAGRLVFALVMTRLHLLVNMHIKRAVLDKLFSMDLAAVHRYRIADLQTYLGPHSNNAGEMFASVVRPLPAAFGVLFLGTVSLLVSPLGMAMAAGLFVGVYFLLRGLHRAQARTGRAQKEHVKQVNFEALDTLSGFRAIAAFSREHVFRGRLWDAFLELNQVLRRRYILLNMTPGPDRHPRQRGPRADLDGLPPNLRPATLDRPALCCLLRHRRPHVELRTTTHRHPLADRGDVSDDAGDR